MMPGNLEPRLNTKEITKPTLEQLYNSYNYQHPKYVVDGNTDQVPFNFEWNSDQIKQLNTAINKVLDSYVEEESFSHHESVKFNGDIEFIFELFKSGPYCAIRIVIFVSGQNVVADFICERQKNKNSWVLKHRLVREQYRNRDIGSKVLQVIEQGLEHEASKVQMPQTLEIDANQLEVTYFALKNGYDFSTQADLDNFKLICSGDRSKILVTTIIDPDDELQKPDFVFPISRLQAKAKDLGLGELTPEELWNIDLDVIFSKDPDMYRAYALTVRLKKEKQPSI